MPDNDVQMIAFLSSLRVSDTLTPREIDVFLDYCETLQVPPREIIADSGEQGQALCFVVEGGAVLVHGDQSQEVELTHIAQGELMGEMSFFDARPRMLRIRASKRGARLLRLTRPMYERLRVEHPYIAVNLLEYAIISLDHMFRRVSSDMADYARYLFLPGKK
jgi:CRP-like cAMP-binding protein